MNRPRHSCAFLAATLALLSASSAFAIEIPANGNGTSLTGTNATVDPSLAGDIVYSDSVGYYTNIGVVETKQPPDVENGYVKSWIVRESTTGFLDYYYQPVVISTGAIGVEAIAINGLPIAPSLDANTVFPSAPASPGATAFYETIFAPGRLFAESGSTTVLIHTSQTSFNPAPTGSIDVLFDHQISGVGSEGLAVVVPGNSSSSPAVPEPASLALLPLALTALSLRLRFNR